jgi:hypothetical protein
MDGALKDCSSHGLGLMVPTCPTSYPETNGGITRANESSLGFCLALPTGVGQSSTARLRMASSDQAQSGSRKDRLRHALGDGDVLRVAMALLLAEM